MYDITLVCTQHKESRICNSLELHNIIKQISPEIIYEELSYSHFNESYKQERLIRLETNTVKEYLKNYIIKHIPVYTYQLPLNYYEDLDRMYNELLYTKMTYESHTLRNLLEKQAALIYLNGFCFLNNDENLKHFEEFNFLNETILNSLNYENLLPIHRLEKEMIEKREYQIIKDIYNFNKINSYETALMFIGSGHGKSIFNVINEFERRETIKLNWKVTLSKVCPAPNIGIVMRITD